MTTTEFPALTTVLAVEATDHSPQTNYVYLLALLPVIVVTFSANVVVICCVYCYRPLHRPNNYYVASLAVADAVVGSVVMSGMLLDNIYGYWPLSEGICTAWIGLDFSCCTISILHLCLIAHDRHCALTKPNEYRSRDRTKMAYIMIALAWLMGLVAWVPAVIFFRLKRTHTPRDCLFLPGKIYVICQSCLIYVIPIGAMLCMYTQCVKGLRKHFRKIASITGSNTLTIKSNARIFVVASFATTDTSAVSPPGDNPSPGGSNEPLDQRRPRKNNKEHIRGVRTLGVVIAVFLFSWVPFCVLWPVQSFCDSCVPIGLFKYSYWAAYLNSAINPVLYFVCNRDFRLAFKNLVGIAVPKM